MTTQFARASYQEIIDLHTESDKVSVIGIHTPTSKTPRQMFGGFFDQFKKFKYLGCSISLVPAARLPADPLQVSYEAGDLTIDPRDMLNPIMFHGCHGNDMGVILNRFYALNSIQDGTNKYTDSIFQVEAETNPGSSTDSPDFLFGDQLENLYYKALTDNTWKKAHPQRGFRKSGLRPLVYSMATNMQFNGSIGQTGLGIPSPLLEYDYSEGNTRMDIDMPVTQGSRRFFTPRLTGLGWLDTRNVLTTPAKPFDTRTGTGDLFDIEGMLNTGSLEQETASEADLPLVYMGMILMPPAYKTEQYFRMIINHHFAFKEFRGISLNVLPAESPAYANFNDDEYSPTPDPDPPEPEPEYANSVLVSLYSTTVPNPESWYFSLRKGITVLDTVDITDQIGSTDLSYAGVTFKCYNYLVRFNEDRIVFDELLMAYEQEGSYSVAQGYSELNYNATPKNITIDDVTYTQNRWTPGNSVSVANAAWIRVKVDVNSS